MEGKLEELEKDNEKLCLLLNVMNIDDGRKYTRNRTTTKGI